MRQALHEHSTLAAFVASAIVGLLVGFASHWSGLAVLLATLAALLTLPRAFFGLKESRTIDKDKGLEDTGPTTLGMYDMAGLDSESHRVDRAYSRATDHFDFAGRPPDPSEFRELAEDEPQ